MQNYEYGGVKFEVPELSGEEYNIFGSYLITPKLSSPAVQRNPIYTGVGKLWDITNFEIARKPIIIDNLYHTKQFSEPGVPRVLDMPIKFPGTGYRLPVEFAQFAETLNKIIFWEHALNYFMHPNYYAYLTVDHSWLEAGNIQRKPGCHVDGFQGPQIPVKTAASRSYVVSDIVPTVFYPQPFNVSHLDDTRHNFFWEFDRQADEDIVFRPEPYEIALMDAYTVHRADIARETGARMFLRITYDLHPFKRLGNSHNPLFDYEWDMESKPIPVNLI